MMIYILVKQLILISAFIEESELIYRKMFFVWTWKYLNRQTLWCVFKIKKSWSSTLMALLQNWVKVFNIFSLFLKFCKQTISNWNEISYSFKNMNSLEYFTHFGERNVEWKISYMLQELEGICTICLRNNSPKFKDFVIKP